ncbi:hypothetical protein FACS1894219_07000 [Clostridia bacterium]|nr:hypothetical protein FACS1894219_07000 [Clostridia bacterium]
MTKFQQWYVKYLVKNPALFYAFLGVFIAVFLIMSLNLKLDVISSYPAEIEGNSVGIQGDNPPPLSSDRLYFYTDRNERIYKANVKSSAVQDGQLLIKLDESGGISGEVTVDFIVGTQTLLERIFVKAGRG